MPPSLAQNGCLVIRPLDDMLGICDAKMEECVQHISKLEGLVLSIQITQGNILFEHLHGHIEEYIDGHLSAEENLTKYPQTTFYVCRLVVSLQNN